jgi:hypothetical protein
VASCPRLSTPEPLRLPSDYLRRVNSYLSFTGARGRKILAENQGSVDNSLVKVINHWRANICCTRNYQARISSSECDGRC